jgi:3-isopropylmalate dehydratase
VLIKYHSDKMRFALTSLLSLSVVSGFNPVHVAPKAAVRTASITSLQAGPRTLYDKIWDDHIVDYDGDSTLLYVDRHLVHEVTSPQAFEGLRISSRGVRRPDCTLTTVDHNVPTEDRSQLIE